MHKKGLWLPPTPKSHNVLIVSRGATTKNKKNKKKTKQDTNMYKRIHKAKTQTPINGKPHIDT